MEEEHIIANKINESPSQTTQHIDIEPNPPQNQSNGNNEGNDGNGNNTNVNDHNNSRVNRYSMMVIGKYLNTFNDFVNIEKCCKEYRGLINQYYYNPIPLKDDKSDLFPNTNTFLLYNSESNDIDIVLKSNNKIKKIIIYEDDDKINEPEYNNIKGKEIIQLPTNITGEFNFNMDPNINVLIGIDDSIYEDNPKIKEIVIPSHIIKIRENCFNCGIEEEERIYGNDSSEGIINIFIPNTVKVICPRAFFNCSITSINIPSSITFIPESCFAKCIRLESIHLHDTIEFFDDNAFSKCSKLKSITLPSSVTLLGNNCFKECSSLSNVIITSNLVSIGDECFSEDNIKHFYSNNDDIITYSVNLPSTLTKLGDFAFEHCNKITSINCNISKIPLGCFKYCNKLETVKLSNKVTRIHSFAFESCIKLKSINLPSSLKDIGSHTFDYCSSLTSINIPSTLTYFEGDCFINCNLIQINIPSNLQRIIKEYSIKDIKDKIKWVSPYN